MLNQFSESCKNTVSLNFNLSNAHNFWVFFAKINMVLPLVYESIIIQFDVF